MNFLVLFFDEFFFCANRIAPDGAPRSAASHLGLYCLSMPPQKGRQAYMS